MEWNFWLDIFKASLTPLIACLGVYIAIQQWKTNSLKLKYEMYDKRFKVYEKVKEFISFVQSGTEMNTKDLLLFISSVSEATFLFGSEIEKYIDELYKHAIKTKRLHNEYRDLTQSKPKNYDHDKVCKEIHEESTWIGNQLKPMKEKFMKYLDISKF